MKKKTNEEYLAQLYDLEIIDIPIESYKGHTTPILHECINGHRVLRTPASVLGGNGCSICAGRKKYTTEDYIN